MSPRKSKIPIAGVRKYHGTEMDTYLKRHPTVLYQYQVNTWGLVVMAIIAVVAAGIASYIWIVEDLSSIWHLLAICLLSLTALGSIARIVYWFYFTKIYYLAASDRDLILGKGTEVIAIDWGHVNAESLGLTGMDWTASAKAVFSIHLGADRYRLRLFNSYACLRNLQGFMSTLLQHILEDKDEGDEGRNALRSPQPAVDRE